MQNDVESAAACSISRGLAYDLALEWLQRCL